MNYDTLFSLGEKYFADKTEAGMQKSKMFFEYLANTGTNAAAMVIKDFVMNNKFHNQLETAKHLSRVPFSIRRPNKKLVVEYEKLLNWPGKNYYDYEKYYLLYIMCLIGAQGFVKMEIPLMFGHLVKMTCTRAGKIGSPEQKKCWTNFASKYVKQFWEKFKAVQTREEKHLYLSAIGNIK